VATPKARAGPPCIRCGRPLRNQRSVRNGMGRDCYKASPTRRSALLDRLRAIVDTQSGTADRIRFAKRTLRQLQRGKRLSRLMLRFLEHGGVTDSIATGHITTLEEFVDVPA
jgi:hypothetical protein